MGAKEWLWVLLAGGALYGLWRLMTARGEQLRARLQETVERKRRGD
jgi:hypothetical protein